jgi:hypothetical protein
MRMSFSPPLLLSLLAALPTLAPAADPDDVLHPGYDLSSARPAGFEPRVAGLDLLPGGRLAVATWEPDEVHVLANADGPAAKMSVRKIADGFSDIMGLCTSGDTIFVADQKAIWRIEDRDRNGVHETKTLIGKLPYTGSFHEWSFGLLRKDGRLYTALSVATTRTGRTVAPQKDPRRGSVVAMDDKGMLEIVATGLRAAEGLGFGPEGTLWATDNQGSWLPASKLIHIRKGKTYGHRIEPAGLYDSLYPAPPAVWMPYGEATKSPTQPILLAAGPHAGQMLYGDIAAGAVRRAYLEKVGGEWQGALFRFSGGFEAAVHRLVPGKDGSVWLGGLGNGDQQNWGWRGKRFGLQRIRPNGKPVFEILSAKAREGGFEVEFTERPGPEALDPKAWTAKRWWYEATASYGGPKKDVADCKVTAVKPSQDGLRAFIAVEGLQPMHVIHLRIPNLRAKSGRELWTTEFWYTLNSLSQEKFLP